MEHDTPHVFFTSHHHFFHPVPIGTTSYPAQVCRALSYLPLSLSSTLDVHCTFGLIHSTSIVTAPHQTIHSTHKHTHTHTLAVMFPLSTTDLQAPQCGREICDVHSGHCSTGGSQWLQLQHACLAVSVCPGRSACTRNCCSAFHLLSTGGKEILSECSIHPHLRFYSTVVL